MQYQEDGKYITKSFAGTRESSPVSSEFSVGSEDSSEYFTCSSESNSYTDSDVASNSSEESVKQHAMDVLAYVKGSKNGLINHLDHVKTSFVQSSKKRSAAHNLRSTKRMKVEKKYTNLFEQFCQKAQADDETSISCLASSITSNKRKSFAPVKLPEGNNSAVTLVSKGLKFDPFSPHLLSNSVCDSTKTDTTKLLPNSNIRRSPRFVISKEIGRQYGKVHVGKSNTLFGICNLHSTTC